MSEPTAALSSGRPESLVGGRYRLEAPVGRGGSAEVWSAVDEALGRKVAVKLVTASGGEDAGRVGDEARLLARLSHPGLVPVYDAGTDDAGRPWVVMELVIGETLADTLRRGALDPVRTAEVGRVLAEALAHVHAEGLVHRDIKPANVLMGRDGRVRLTDFGIARLVDAARVTATGLTVGTAGYLSPEQVTGAHVGPLSDVYSLGLVLLECLTGAREYPGTAVEVALARLSRQPRVPATLPAGWPGLLEAMTAREPAGRPTADEVALELTRIAMGGSATTAVRTTAVDERTQVMDRTALLTGVAPAAPVREPRADGPPPVRPVPRPVAPPPGGGLSWRWVVALFVAVGLILGALLLYDRVVGGPGTPPPAVSPSVPDELRDDLEQLKREIAS